MIEMEKKVRIYYLVKELNKHRNLYYNEATPEVSDAEYDKLFDELEQLEQSTGLVLSNSPTQNVGATVVSALTKVQHPIPLLSLDKTKSLADVVKFIGGKAVLLMLKKDGLTVELKYQNHQLVQASTRGDGYEGEDITHNARMFRNIPLTIPYGKDLTITGEAIILKDDFQQLQATTVGSDGKPYKNARNLAAGSVRQLDAGECAKRFVQFVAFNVLKGFDGIANTNSKLSMLNALDDLGFATVHRMVFNKNETVTVPTLELRVKAMREYAADYGFPIDGLVASYDDVAYSQSLGHTSHHYRDGIAFKFEDEKVETVLRKVEWKVSRSGELAPVAVFDTVELDGTDVSRASLHNLDFIRNLNLAIGDRVLISKRNMIIPHVEENLDYGDMQKNVTLLYPNNCPSCGNAVIVTEDSALVCKNDNCSGRKLRSLAHFVSKKAMDIDGLSESTLEKLMNFGLLDEVADLYRLKEYRPAIEVISGLGERAADNLLTAIEESRHTTLERFIISMDIPELGQHASKILCNWVTNPITIQALAMSGHDFSSLEGFGDVLNDNIHAWFESEENLKKWETVLTRMVFEEKATPMVQADSDNPFYGKTIVATGTFEHFTRDSINTAIESLGAKAGSSVSSKTDFVIAGEKAGSKKAKAEALGIRVLTEQEFLSKSGL